MRVPNFLNTVFMASALLTSGQVRYHNPIPRTFDTIYPTATPKSPEAVRLAEKQPLLPQPTNALITWKPTFNDELNQLDNSRWQKADWSNGTYFACTWRPENLTFDNGIMSLTVNDDGCPKNCRNKAFASAEYESLDTYHYGYYEASLKAAKGAGVTTGFFIYSGVYRTPSHNEITWEIRGKDTNLALTNYFPKGESGHSKAIRLWFDPTDAFHNYGIKWTPRHLSFYVDGVKVREVNAAADGLGIPTVAGKIKINNWPGTISNIFWSGRFDYASTGPTAAQIDWIKYSTLADAPKEE